ncbi:hypothetical protein B4125_1835 [Bacillus paralicheniformis]|nr:hypothetical protein SC10_B2orf03434 [Bacillus paralicheniformis]OLG07654.1 hypothetical protein B4125_1835 [Bacillus paralicheniformis]TWM04369.1 hypothetical protein CHCC15136_2536 [Bacillus paralicheniformis]TWM43927.1 hypothetical protein CHCC14817_4058 [Bacillus paralicheniformis]TWN71470.1 hypothetical protein CHCC12620_2371 [Bacillus paralicheniformis]
MKNYLDWLLPVKVFYIYSEKNRKKGHRMGDTPIPDQMMY